MKKKLLSTALLMFIGAAMAFAQTADEVINKHIDAMGGKDKIAGLKAVKMVASVDVGPNMKAPMTMYIVNNKSFRMDMEIQGMKMSQAVDGDSGWAVNPFGGKKEAERMNAEDIRNSKDQMELTGSLFNYKEKGSKVEYIGKEDMEGTDTYKLKVTKKNGDNLYVYLDAGSYLQLKETSKHKFQDKEITSETIFSNFKKVDGIMFPFTIENREVGESSGQAMNFDEIVVNPKIDNMLFKMPAAAPAAAPEEKK